MACAEPRRADPGGVGGLVDGHSLLMFRTGVGDGNYAIYSAYKGDRLVGIVADFRTLPNS